MIINDRLQLLDDSHGPVTVVRSFLATEDERARAFSQLRAHGIVFRICASARWGERTNLIAAFELVSPSGHGFGYRNVTDEFLAEPVLTAASQGRLLVVPGWPGLSPPRSEDAGSPEARVCARAMRGRAGLLLGGQVFRLVPAGAWRAEEGFEVVGQAVAGPTLHQISQQATGDERAALAEAVALLADTRTPHVRGGLFLVRRVRPMAFAADRRDEPAFTPSQLRTATQKEPEPTWFEVAVIDEVGEPVAGAELVFDVDGLERSGSTGGNGCARLEGAHDKSGTVRLTSMKALRAKLDAPWTRGRVKDWISPPAGSAVIEVCATEKPPTVALRAEKRATIVLVPPYRVRLLDGDDKPMSGLACTVSVAGAKHKLTADGQGWVEFAVGAACPELARIEWHEQRDGAQVDRRLDVALPCYEGDDNAVAKARLGNLGYPVDVDLEMAVAAFLADHELEPEELAGDEIPEAVRVEIAKAWEELHA